MDGTLHLTTTSLKKIKDDLKNPIYYINRELSFLEFNRRVLNEAEDTNHPLLERLKFVSIFSSNLDEFFMIRVAGLKSQVYADTQELSYDGLTAQQQLIEIRKKLLPLYEYQTRLFKEIMSSLEKENIQLYDINTLTKRERERLRKFFIECVLPVLTPLTLDQAHPFPRLINLRLNIAFVLRDPSKETGNHILAFLQLPTVLPRMIRLEHKPGYHFVLLEQIIKDNAELIFPGLEILGANVFRVTRNADIEIAEDEAEDLLSEISEQVKQRRWSTAAVRLEVSSKMDEFLLNLLMRTLNLDKNDIYIHDRPLGLPDFMQLVKLDKPSLKDKPFSTFKIPEFIDSSTNIFSVISSNDYLVHHPFDSFTNSTLRFLEQAAVDPNVLAIKITLYRTGSNSPVVAALIKAAENGKDVTAFVELKARFDEENNIIWAKELEQKGVNVVYGVVGLKTHCKITLVIRRENGKLKKYLHLSTGNYNHITARLYTDIGYFTSKEELGFEAIHLFNFLTGYSLYKDWKDFVVAPVNLYERTLELIQREIDLHTPENPGLIFAKMNSLAHRQVIPALYRASQKGVQIKLLVRGICCLKPGLPGISENIEVRSILGRFLEHSRIFYFKNGGNEEFYLSSADWMSRNLHKRVELMFPIKDKKNQKRLWSILNIYWNDNLKSWKLNSDGSYTKIKPAKNQIQLSAQEYFIREINELKSNHR